MALPEKLNVLELFCGIGGMHYALQGSCFIFTYNFICQNCYNIYRLESCKLLLLSFVESGLDFEVKCAVDINTVTNAVYQHNFPSQPLAQREIQV